MFARAGSTSSPRGGREAPDRGVASALANLSAAGFSPAVQDVSVEKLDLVALRRAKLVAISVPMHTALRLGTRVAA